MYHGFTDCADGCVFYDFGHRHSVSRPSGEIECASCAGCSVRVGHAPRAALVFPALAWENRGEETCAAHL